MLWQQSQSLRVRPSDILRIEDDYVAYCLDEAVFYFGMTLQARLDKVGHKPSKEERAAESAQLRILDEVLGDEKDAKRKNRGFADPALMFN